MSDENVQVVVKMRPLIQREIKKCLPIQWAVDGNTIYQKDGKINYQFDNIFNIDSKNQDIFISTVQPIINEFLSGINCTILTYGQTSSGKTHTMIGSKTDTGLIPLIISHIFNFIENDLSRDYQLQFSYFELYNEKVIDLFDNNKNNKHLKIKEDKNGNVLIDCKQLVLKTTKEVLQKLKKVNNNRHVSETNMNEKSNRSHVLLRITIESCETGDDSDGTIKTSQLTLVDLAGSENAKQAGGTNERRNEGRFINRSLSSLCSVINQLSDKNKKKTNDKIPFINYRDSKLTRLLQPSLGGNSKTMVICTVTPAALEETQSTLTFARRAKVIKNQPRINQEVTDKVIIKKLVKQMSELQEKIEQLKTQDVDKKLINKFPLKRRNSLIGNESVKELEQHFISKNKEILSSLKVKNNKCTSKLNYPLRRSTSMNISSSFKLEISNFEKELDEAEKEKLFLAKTKKLFPKDIYNKNSKKCNSGLKSPELFDEHYELKEKYDDLVIKYENLEAKYEDLQGKYEIMYEKKDLQIKKMKKKIEELEEKNSELIEIMDPIVAKISTCTCDNVHEHQKNDIVTLDPLKKKRKRMSLQSVLSPIKDTSGLDNLDGLDN